MPDPDLCPHFEKPRLTEQDDDIEFLHLMDRAPEWVRYRPVRYLSTGQLHGYYVHVCLPQGAGFDTLESLIANAEQTGRLRTLHQAVWQEAMGSFQSFPRQVVLFLHVYGSAGLGLDPAQLESLQQQTQETLVQVVFELSPTFAGDFEVLAGEVSEVRKYGFKVCMKSSWNGYPWPLAIARLHPDYVKADAILTRGASANHTQVIALETLVELARKLNCHVIVEGLDQEADLKLTMGLGAQFGTGELLGPLEQGHTVHAGQVQQHIQAQIGRMFAQYHGYVPAKAGLEKIVRPVKTVHEGTRVEEVVHYLNASALESGVVVTRGNEPVGLVIRERLFQRLATKYGYSLFGNKAISRLMERDPLVLEIDTPLETVSRLAMARKYEHVYDLVIVTRLGQLVGVVTVQDILNAVTSAQIELARDANPLTGLPGNRRIEQEILWRLSSGRAFTIIYTDLDYFKWFNDRFGFQKGDLVIGYTAQVLKDSAAAFGFPGDFVGHIGGDDFILITETDDVEQLCSDIIERFEEGVTQYYPNGAHGTEDFDITDRHGQRVHSNGLSISLSVLECREYNRTTTSLELISEEAGELKKRAKNTFGSVYVRGALSDTNAAIE
ncbi:GGDEF domain-containing protein [Alicyclobacillus cycloheptanicus]|uniref:Diguanylate cyclase (GGDEF)-like protein n=1 Tax=Alicyclobacillus cycloheptanicus TaxID=1457 RepID=A0ABT9XFP0_9BACL|nr:GGDEF domain-containing protein [Alicyclobacillus cycloheptanicus]MDQ0189117.1 diguanylate cyclase (GGDEF)-like protein [Alicyclobacillus cycloheptanicus]WDM00247.1 GGDEF domain-containing protein [Alicyclobacillus cycloheptanicus]